MSIRNVPVHPHSPWLPVGGALIVLLLLVVLGIAIGIVMLRQSSTMPEQQVVPTAGQAVNVVPSARDKWWAEQPAQPAVTAPARDQWWAEQPAVTAPARDKWWAEQPAVTAPARDQWWLDR